MSEAYPLPAHAAYIWVAGADLFLGLPPVPGGTKGHQVRLPATDRGLAVALDILRERARAPGVPHRYGGHVIGTKGAPVQYDIEEVLRRLGKPSPGARAEELREAEDLLKEAGL
jgi:hypothetical protein